MEKSLLCLDWDGVIHSYTSGWKGADIIPDPPVPGALDFLEEAVKHFRVAIFSSRSGHHDGIQAMMDWLCNGVRLPDGKLPQWVWEIEWPTEKPPAFLTLDDRAMTFDGTWPAMETLKAFKPWNKR